MFNNTFFLALHTHSAAVWLFFFFFFFEGARSVSGCVFYV